MKEISAKLRFWGMKERMDLIVAARREGRSTCTSKLLLGLDMLLEKEVSNSEE